MIELIANDLYVDTYLKIREKVNWKKLTYEQAKKALENSLYTVVALENGKFLGMGRIVGDGSVICYVQDLILIPEAQGRGVGKLLLEDLKSFVQSIQLDNTEMMFDLMCAKGREEFYEKLGFTARPTDTLGPGMIQYLHKCGGQDEHLSD